MEGEHPGIPGLRRTEHPGAVEAGRRACKGPGGDCAGPEGGSYQGLCSFFKDSQTIQLCSYGATDHQFYLTSLLRNSEELIEQKTEK